MQGPSLADSLAFLILAALLLALFGRNSILHTSTSAREHEAHRSQALTRTERYLGYFRDHSVVARKQNYSTADAIRTIRFSSGHGVEVLSESVVSQESNLRIGLLDQCAGNLSHQNGKGHIQGSIDFVRLWVSIVAQDFHDQRGVV